MRKKLLRDEQAAQLMGIDVDGVSFTFALGSAPGSGCACWGTTIPSQQQWGITVGLKAFCRGRTWWYR